MLPTSLGLSLSFKFSPRFTAEKKTTLLLHTLTKGRSARRELEIARRRMLHLKNLSNPSHKSMKYHVGCLHWRRIAFSAFQQQISRRKTNALSMQSICRDKWCESTPNAMPGKLLKQYSSNVVQITLQGREWWFVRGLVKFLPALAYLFCLALYGSCIIGLTYLFSLLCQTKMESHDNPRNRVRILSKQHRPENMAFQIINHQKSELYIWRAFQIHSSAYLRSSNRLSRGEMSSKVQSADLNGSGGGGRLYTHFCIQDGKLHLQIQGVQLTVTTWDIS